MSEPGVFGRFKVKRHEFYAALSEEMLSYVDTHGEEVGVQMLPYDELDGHHPSVANHHKRMACAVCKLEEGWMKQCNIRQAYGEGSRQQRHMSICSTCGISAHSLPVLWKRKIFQWEDFRGKSCFHIAHSASCAGLFILKTGVNNLTLRRGKQ